MLTVTSCQKIVTPLPLFQFMANLQPSESKIPDGWSMKVTFSIIVTLYLTKTEKRTKKSLTQFIYYFFE